MYSLSGIAVADGVAAAPALIVSKISEYPEIFENGSFDPQIEIDLYHKKCTDFAGRLRQISNPAKDKVRDLFGAAAGFLLDKTNQAEIIKRISRGTPATMACREVYLGSLNGFVNPADGDGIAEIKELRGLIAEFIGTLRRLDSTKVELPKLSKKAVIIAKELSPAMFLSLATENVSAVVLEGGRASGHLGTVLRELGIPSVFGVVGATDIAPRSPVLVDASNAAVIVDPPDETVHAMLTRQDMFGDEINDDSPLNITIAGSIGAARKIGSNKAITNYGLGLLRSEFLFLSSEHEPTLEEMTAVFTDLFDKIPQDKPITARTFDFADDKTPMFHVSSDDKGPLRGYGAKVGTRLLKNELKALLLAAPGRSIRIVFPLVTRVSESKYLNDLAKAAAEELDKEEAPRAQYEVALMIETPAAVLSAPAFADQCSMFIIGTSSLAEYAAAPRPADISFTPALAKMIVMAAKAAHDAGVPVGIAGRYATRIELMPFFYKSGSTYITVDSYQIAKLRQAIERLNIEDVSPKFDIRLYNQVMSLFSGRELAALINDLNIGE